MQKNIYNLTLLIFLFSSEAALPVTQVPWKACASHHQTKQAQKLFERGCVPRPENVGIAHQRALIYYESGCFDRELTEVIKQAKKNFSQPAQHDKQAIIFDVDDTVLFYYCNSKEIQFGFVPELFHEWVMKASATTVPVMKSFYNYLRRQGYHIIFLTGRKMSEYEATEKNLRDQGFTGYERLIVRSEKDHGLSAQKYKECRRKELMAEGWDIVGNVGDQESDSKGTPSCTIVKVPNYLYNID